VHRKETGEGQTKCAENLIYLFLDILEVALSSITKNGVIKSIYGPS
jgi:hypothetical protein